MGKHFLVLFMFLTSLSTRVLAQEKAPLPLNTAFKIYVRKNATEAECPKFQKRGDLLKLVETLKDRNEKNLNAQEEAPGFLGLYESNVVQLREGKYFWSGRPYLMITVTTLEDLYDGGTRENYYWRCEYSGI